MGHLRSGFGIEILVNIVFLLLVYAQVQPAMGCAFPQNLAGDWTGALKVGATQPRLVVHASKTESGARKGTMMDGLGQSANGQAAPRRPQNPVRPYPYREEEVSYENKAAGITLTGTLTIPQGKGPFPAAVLIAGSGPHDRDETVMGHKPFLILADYLTRKGIAVLRSDKRGVGKSGGDYGTATTPDFAADAEAAFAYLQTRREINPKKIGLIGHSEGAVIAPMIAAHNPQVEFIVMMAGTGVPLRDALPVQVMRAAEAGGAPPEVAEKYAVNEREILTMLVQGKDDNVIEERVREMMGAKVSAQADVEAKQQVRFMNSPWFRWLLTYDPAPALRKVKCPVLALDGEKDVQVDAKQNLTAIRQALEAGGNRNFETVDFPGLNHLFQTAKTGSPAEYAEIEETISPIVLDKITRWILAR
jgi:pimeloyl-ACP methyl ester carboxylesterase